MMGLGLPNVPESRCDCHLSMVDLDLGLKPHSGCGCNPEDVTSVDIDSACNVRSMRRTLIKIIQYAHMDKHVKLQTVF